MKVLLVDDDQSSGASLTQAFMEENYVVNLVTDGETALQIARSCPYDLIVLNLISPNQASVELCETLRGEGYRGSIMMMSHENSGEASLERDRSLSAGANDCISPTEDIQEVITRMQALLSQTPAS